MDSNLKIEDVFMQIRDKLNKDGIKLWLEPYYSEKSGSSESDLKRLAEEYATILNLPFDQCRAALSELQSNALEKLKQRDRFKESGLASFKIKVVIPKASPKIIAKEILLSALGLDLKDQIAGSINVSSERLKLIANGIVIKDTENLSHQGLKNGQQILAIILTETPQEVKKKEDQIKEVENTKKATNLLVSDNDEYLQLEDQQGNAIFLPKKEKRSLMVAMTLHEKGRAALKKDDFALALVFFLDADKEFDQVNSKLLDSVDNYALLDLDIAWCYLCLQSLIHLPEAYQRLKRCEERFHKSYGPNLERLIAVKGTPGNEAALFMRLHLLQAIVFYHQNQRNEALQLLHKAQMELRDLKVDEPKILMLVELGYSPAEARLGLRATHGDVNSAANYINENRRIRVETRRKAKADRILQKEKMKFGKCDDGKQYIDPNFVRMLVNMGYSREAARIALKKCNNIITDSIQYITEHPLPGPSSTKSKEMLSLIDDLLPELEAAGFDKKMARLALKKHNADVMAAADELLRNGGIIFDAFDDDDDDSEEEEKKRKKKEEESKKKEEALARIAQDISMVDDDHLDLTLEKEEQFLIQYLSLLQD